MELLAQRHTNPWFLPSTIALTAITSCLVNKYVRNYNVKVGIAASMAIPLLFYPIGNPRGLMTTVMECSLVGMVAIQSFSSLFFSSDKTPKQQTKDATETKEQQEPSLLMSLLSSFGSYVFYAFPIRRTEQSHKTTWESRDWMPIVKQAAMEVCSGAFKLMVAPFFERALFYLTTDGRAAADLALTTTLAGNSGPFSPIIYAGAYARRYLHFANETFLYAGLAAALVYPFFDFITAGIRVATKNTYEIMSFNDFVALSSNLRELWGKRYNKIVNSWLRLNLFDPLLARKWSPAAAANAAFATSALLHVYVVYFSFGNDIFTLLRAASFFVIHGCLCTYERKILGSHYNTTVGRSFTMLSLYLTLPIYLGLFVEGFPTFGIQNSMGISDFANSVADIVLPSSATYSLQAISA